jgi:hypothetical protein
MGRWTVADDRSGVLLVRVWLEDGGGFRARLTAPGPSKGRDPGRDITVALASSPAAVSEAISAWLRCFVGSATGLGSDVPRSAAADNGIPV